MAQALATAAPEEPDADQHAVPYPMEPGAVDAAMRPPAEPAGYVMAAPKGVSWDPTLEKAARAWFFNAGLPQSVATGIVQQYCRRVCGGDGVSGATRGPEEIARLRSEWGPDWDRNVGLARAVVQSSSGGQQLLDILDGSGLGNDAWLIRTLAAVGQSRAR
jgi:hypothetical protein